MWYDVDVLDEAEMRHIHTHARTHTRTHARTHQSIPTDTHQTRMKISCSCRESKISLVITQIELLFVKKIIYNKSIMLMGTNNLCRS